jgi:N4-gp56 family major capsid protein
MADAYTQQSSLKSDTAAFDLMAYFAFRSQPVFETIATVRSTNQSHVGASVTFTKYSDLAAATSALGETTDPDAVALSDSQVVVTLNEYGNAVLTTAKLRGTSFLSVDSDAANIVGYNMVDSVDTVVRDVAVGGTNVKYVGQTAQASITASDNMTAAIMHEQVAALRGANVPTFRGGNYVMMIHPDVSYDLRQDTGVTDIIQFQIRQDAANYRRGSIGVFGGVEIIESPRVKIVTDGGATTTDVYQNILAGQQALAKGFSTATGFGPDPSVVHGPVTDKLMRFRPVGWYHLVGYARFREESLRRIECASSIGANAS